MQKTVTDRTFPHPKFMLKTSGWCLKVRPLGAVRVRWSWGLRPRIGISILVRGEGPELTCSLPQEDTVRRQLPASQAEFPPEPDCAGSLIPHPQPPDLREGSVCCLTPRWRRSVFQLEVRQKFKQLYKYTNYTNIWIKMFTKTLFVRKNFFNFNIYQKRNYQINHGAFIIWDSEQLWERIGEIHMNMEIYPHDTVLNGIKQVAK